VLVILKGRAKTAESNTRTGANINNAYRSKPGRSPSGPAMIRKGITEAAKPTASFVMRGSCVPRAPTKSASNKPIRTAKMITL